MAAGHVSENALYPDVQGEDGLGIPSYDSTELNSRRSEDSLGTPDHILYLEHHGAAFHCLGAPLARRDISWKHFSRLIST